MAQKPASMDTMPIRQRSRYSGSLLVRNSEGPCRNSIGRMNTKPKKLRKKAISNGCSWLDASRMQTAMQPKMTVLATISPTARLTSAARDAGVLAFKPGRRRSAHR